MPASLASLVYHAGMDYENVASGQHIYTPSELNREVKLHLEAGFPRLLVEAEISNLSRPASGHLYFTLKDNQAQIRCAMFRSAASRCALQPANGMKVIARGRLGLYEPRGEYQFIADGLREAGEGLLQQQFEALKKKLQSEGLFESGRKRKVPPYPRRIGVITSASGAAIRDIVHVLQRRWPVAEVRLYAVAVQGAESAAEIVAALNRANREQWAELLIIGRGGGSLEDLQAFNDESVARAMAASELPTVSAVGHETDISISDFIADLRAPTPSAAAELVTPDAIALRQALDRTQRLLEQRMLAHIQQQMQKVDYLAHRLAQRDPVRQLADRRARLAQLTGLLHQATMRSIRHREDRLNASRIRLQLRHPRVLLADYRRRLELATTTSSRAIRQQLTARQSALQDLARTLHAVSPLDTIARGYAVLRNADDDELIGSIANCQVEDRVTAQLRDGRLHCVINEISDETAEAE